MGYRTSIDGGISILTSIDKVKDLMVGWKSPIDGQFVDEEPLSDFATVEYIDKKDESKGIYIDFGCSLKFTQYWLPELCKLLLKTFRDKVEDLHLYCQGEDRGDYWEIFLEDGVLYQQEFEIKPCSTELVAVLHEKAGNLSDKFLLAKDGKVV